MNNKRTKWATFAVLILLISTLLLAACGDAKPPTSVPQVVMSLIDREAHHNAPAEQKKITETEFKTFSMAQLEEAAEIADEIAKSNFWSYDSGETGIAFEDEAIILFWGIETRACFRGETLGEDPKEFHIPQGFTAETWHTARAGLTYWNCQISTTWEDFLSDLEAKALREELAAKEWLAAKALVSLLEQGPQEVGESLFGPATTMCVSGDACILAMLRPSKTMTYTEVVGCWYWPCAITIDGLEVQIELETLYQEIQKRYPGCDPWSE